MNTITNNNKKKNNNDVDEEYGYDDDDDNNNNNNNNNSGVGRCEKVRGRGAHTHVIYVPSIKTPI